VPSTKQPDKADKPQPKPKSILNAQGHEVPGDHTVAIPIRFRTAETISSQVQRLVQYEVSLYAEANGYETFDEADDFEVEDDIFPTSQHEMSQEVEDYDRNQGWADAEKDYVTSELKRRKRSVEPRSEERESDREGPKPDKRKAGGPPD